MMLENLGKKQLKRGARSFMEPTVEKDEFGEVVRSGIYTYGETVHLFVERKNYSGTFFPVIKMGVRLQPRSLLVLNLLIIWLEM